MGDESYKIPVPFLQSKGALKLFLSNNCPPPLLFPCISCGRTALLLFVIFTAHKDRTDICGFCLLPPEKTNE
jgi:hypothetical protein